MFENGHHRHHGFVSINTCIFAAHAKAFGDIFRRAATYLVLPIITALQAAYSNVFLRIHEGLSG